MKIVLTGASSFTGYWFARELVKAEHQVVAPLRAASLDQYSGVRRDRVARLTQIADIRWDASFGSERFLQILGAGCDLLCHHAAQVENYKSIDFDVLRAVDDNTRNIRFTIEVGRATGLLGIVLTGSVFEPDEGAGDNPLRAFSPYGLSKSLSFQVVRYWAELAKLPVAKLVIPNPFGPFEDPRFCAYLLRCWTSGETASVKTPGYVRDNIHVTLLARTYVGAVERLAANRKSFSYGPSGYVETQGAFAQRFAAEIGSRLGIASPRLILEKQTDFSEPLIRFNRDRAQDAVLDWDEGQAWDELAAYYHRTYLERNGNSPP